MFSKVLIANRGAIAVRIIRTLKKMGIKSVAVYSEADVGSLHVELADEAVLIGAPLPSQSYLDINKIIGAALKTGAEAIHPGYGFLSENALFAEACAKNNIVFIGPNTESLEVFGKKHTARELAQSLKIPLASGTPLLKDADAAKIAASEIGYPVMLKATAGGGGIGMRICNSESEILEAFESVARLGKGNFADSGVFLETYIANARHIEVQVFGDGKGKVKAFGERDCSLQRRNQKVVEETPAPNLPQKTRERIIECAATLMSGAKYLSAGTVEFLYDTNRDDFFFLEVNTRLQVEHGVTEEVFGIDLVEFMIRGAYGDFSFLDKEYEQSGHAVQVRIYAEDPANDFRPISGRLISVKYPEAIRAENVLRIDTWVRTGSEVSSFYDPMLAKIIVKEANRNSALKAMKSTLDNTILAGFETNLDWLKTVISDENIGKGIVSTKALAGINYAPNTIQVISGGAETTIQDYPGRTKYWAVGVPPSGPFDAYSLRLGNSVLGNETSAAGLEITAQGPILKFLCDTAFIITGAQIPATLDGQEIENFKIINARAGQVLQIGRVNASGIRSYFCVKGGFNAPKFLGSRASFNLGEFGGHAGRKILAGDTLHLIAPETLAEQSITPTQMSNEWELRVLYGPHGSPDFFTDNDIKMINSHIWQVHYNSNRTGVRLIGDKPEWARKDGGEAGLHPSNIHDNAYAIGAIDFTGDMPIILGPDGPSLGGFVCPFVVIEADLWKIGQLAAGDKLRLLPVSERDAQNAKTAMVESLKNLTAINQTSIIGIEESPIIKQFEAQGTEPSICIRRQGDCNLLIEYGPIALDIEIRLKVHALMLEFEKQNIKGIIDLTPGIRSLQIHYDNDIISQSKIVEIFETIEEKLSSLDDIEIPSRIVHLPLSYGDPAIWQTIDKYIQAVRDDAPWCPSNIEFIRRVNGLSHIDEVKQIVFDANYLVLGLGDVYLGAPVATPIDPRHRLVTTKYNPARTWTPPNVVGIGGAYMCIYGMEGPGGYQLFGRTIQVWNSWQQTDAFIDGKPWLLRFFDQIKFFEISAEELVEWRRDFPLGRKSIEVEDTVFKLSDYRKLLADNEKSIKEFQAKRQAAFDEERAHWQEIGEFDRVAALTEESTKSKSIEELEIPPNCELIEAPFGACVWEVRVKTDENVKADDSLLILEAMKVECPIIAPKSGIIRKIYVTNGEPVSAGTPLFAIEYES